jgi:hypothetical protein
MGSEKAMLKDWRMAYPRMEKPMGSDLGWQTGCLLTVRHLECLPMGMRKDSGLGSRMEYPRMD